MRRTAPPRAAWIPRSALAASMLLIVVATLAPHAASNVGAPVGWTFTTGALPVTDASANVLLFVPLGATLVWCGMRVSWAAVTGLLLSLLIEMLQSRGMPSGRYPTVADLLSNGSGALIGALLASIRRQLLRPSPMTAQRLTVGWTLAVCGVFAGTAWMLAPVAVVTGPGGLPIESPLPNMPGYPWFPGHVREVTLSGVRFRPVGTGQMRIEAPWAEREGQLTVFPELGYSRPLPLLFVHAHGETVPQLIVSHHEHDAELRSTRRGDSRGVRMPMLVLANAFRDGSAHTLRFGVTTQALRLAVVQGGRADSATLSLTPTLGWVLAQDELGDGAATLALGTTLWLLALVGPAFYWAHFVSTATEPAGARRLALVSSGRAVAVTVMAALTTTLVFSARSFALAPVPPWQWGIMCLAALLATAFAHGVGARPTRD